MLPAARKLAGRFPPGSGPNCFGTVMDAAGARGAANVWMQRAPFEQWLADVSRPGGHDDDPGTLLVWRSPAGLAQHVAVTLGGGWALHKPSQGWMSPSKVLNVREIIQSAREPGRHLSRRSLTTQNPPR
jgi:cell wall-associated NlpC family hydrolase